MGKFQMSNYRKLYLCAALAAVSATSAQGGTKVSAACMYESGQNGNQTISDFTIWNTAAFIIPKGTVVTFTSTGAPGKTFTTKAPKDIAPQDTFSSGGTIPAGSCQATWVK
jgi:hypothetical protein